MAQQFVIDANATLGLFLQLPYSNNIYQRMQEWRTEEVKLTVPTLWEYECLTGIRRAVTLKLITSQDAERMVDVLLALQIQRVAPTLELHHSALRWAARIGQSKVYDSQYLALAESLSAEFWTADQRLYHTLQELAVNWVHAI